MRHMSGILFELLKKAIIVAPVGGILAYLLGIILPMISGIEMVGNLIGGILAIVLLLFVAFKTDIDIMTFFEIAVLLLTVSIIGTFIIGIFPMVTPYILTLSGTLTWMSVAWSLVYVGLALIIYDMFL